MKQINSPNPACGQFEVQALTHPGSRDFFHLYLKAPGWEYRPGQFVMIRPADWGNDPVWPRPFSICEQTENSLRLFIQVIGRGTDLISRLQPGSLVNLWGPLGNGFRYDPGESLYILAGGMGIAPFMGLCKTHPHPEQISLLFGHRVDIGCYPFAELPGKIYKKHLKQNTPAEIVDFQEVLKKEIQGFAGRGRVLACGPTPFLRVIREYANKFRADCLLSLENKMACGVGACLGCAAKTGSGDFVQTCTHGPVFRSDEVVLES
ncbi:MAG: dihydroorotate dehydrogenase electron transfer subunit [Desulfonatronovibrio sp.]